MNYVAWFCIFFAVLYTVSIFFEKDPIRRTVYSVGAVILCALANVSDQIAHLVK